MLKHLKTNKAKWIIIFFALLLLADSALGLINLIIVEYLEQTFNIQQRIISTGALVIVLILIISLLAGNVKWINKNLKIPRMRKI